MSGARDFIHTYDNDKGQSERIAGATASELERKQVNFVEFIESLAEYLKSEDVIVRSKALHYLSRVLAYLPSNFLSRQQTLVMTEFLCDRIHDGGAVSGLQVLLGMPRFNGTFAVMTVQAVLSLSKELQTRPQSQRFEILQLLNSLLSNYRGPIQNLGSESLVGILRLVRGEKDPRCLMIVFSILQVMVAEWDISGDVEMCFDACFCYFPITFRPPPDDPYGITAQDLKLRLRDCIAASSLFAPYTFPQLIEKLDAGSATIKSDVLSTILTCVQLYHVGLILDHCSLLWDSLKYEIFNSSEDELTEQSILIFESLVARVCSDQAGRQSTQVLAIVDPILRDCVERLREPEHKQAKPAGRLLQAISTVALPAFSAVVEALFPIILSLYGDTTSLERRRAILQSILLVLDSASSIRSSKRTHEHFPESDPLAHFKDRIFSLCTQAAMESKCADASFRVLALRCLLKLSGLRGFMQIDDVSKTLQYLLRLATDETIDGDLDVRKASIEGLLETSRANLQPILEMTIPKLVSNLPDSGLPNIEECSKSLNVLSSLSANPALSDIVIRRLFSRLEAAIRGRMSTQYDKMLLASLLSCFNRGCLLDDCFAKYGSRVIDLVRLAARLSISDPWHPFMDESTFDALGRLASVLLRGAGSMPKLEVARQTYELYTGSTISIYPTAGGELLLPPRLTIIISTHLITALQRETVFPDPSVNRVALLEELVKRYIEEISPGTSYFLLEHIGILVNKFMNDTESQESFATINGLLDSTIETATFQPLIRVLFAMSKALLLRLCLTETVLDRLIDLLSSGQASFEAAQGFELLLESRGLLSQESGCKIHPLAKQRVFTYCVGTLRNKIIDSEGQATATYLAAFCGLLKNVTPSILLPEIERILPLLLQCLDSADLKTKFVAVDTVLMISQRETWSLERYFSNLLHRLLRVSQHHVEKNSQLRHKAILCLCAFPGRLKDVILIPHLLAVEQGLVAALDDPKRHVRKEAVDCKVAWSRIAEVDVEV